MALTRQDETELLTSLHEGSLQASPWSTFLRRLRRRLQADDARFLIARLGSPDLPALEFVAPSGHGDDAPRPGGSRARAGVPSGFENLRPNRIYAENEVPLSAADEAAGAYRRVVRIIDDAGASGWLDVIREDRPFRAADAAFISQLAPHLAIALRGFVALNRVRLCESVASHGLARLGAGPIVIDRRGHVVEWSAHADSLLRTINPQWRGHDGMLRIGREIDAAIAKGVPCAIRIPADPPIDCTLAPLTDPANAVVSGAAMVLYVRGDLEREPELARTLSHLLGIPMSEARLAACLATGQSLSEAAATLGLTIETARNYSKRLYAKTGTRGQPDLVRVILGSGAALA